MTTIAHPRRYSATGRVMPPRLCVLHTSEGSEGVDSAEALVRFIEAPPQQRPDGSYNVASYHVVFDTDRRIEVVEDHLVAYSAPGANTDGLHGCHPGRAGQTREQWLEPVSRGYIAQAALWIVDKSEQYGRDYGRRLTVMEVLAGMVGYCDHWTITQAYKRSDHWDVGPNYPFDVLDSDISALRRAQPDHRRRHHMATLIVEEGSYNVWAYDGAGHAQLLNPAGTTKAQLDNEIAQRVYYGSLCGQPDAPTQPIVVPANWLAARNTVLKIGT